MSEASKPTKKWELSVLFDADQETAERILERYGSLISDAVPSAAAGVHRIDDLLAWESCRCGQVTTDPAGRALRYLADNLMESGLEIGELVEEMRR